MTPQTSTQKLLDDIGAEEAKAQAKKKADVSAKDRAYHSLARRAALGSLAEGDSQKKAVETLRAVGADRAQFERDVEWHRAFEADAELVRQLAATDREYREAGEGLAAATRRAEELRREADQVTRAASQRWTDAGRRATAGEEALKRVRDSAAADLLSRVDDARARLSAVEDRKARMSRAKEGRLDIRGRLLVPAVEAEQMDLSPKAFKEVDRELAAAEEAFAKAAAEAVDGGPMRFPKR